MQPSFNVKRERDKQLHCYSYRNDMCLFQFHSPIEIYFVDEGKMEMIVGGKQRVLQAGEFSVALSYDTHLYRSVEPSRSSVMLIPPHLCEEFALLTKGKRLASPFVSDPEIYARLKHYWRVLREERVSPIRQRGYVYVVLGILAEYLKFEESAVPDGSNLATRLLLYISENFKNDATPATVADAFGYSQSYLSRYFKACFGITLGAYLTTVKLKNALGLIKEGKHDITYCAMESGFTSMRTFYRVFREEFGCSPKSYQVRNNIIPKNAP